jgi:hypothetical protein
MWLMSRLQVLLKLCMVCVVVLEAFMQRWSEGISDGRAPPCSDLHCPTLRHQACRQGQCEAEQGGHSRAALAGVASKRLCLLRKLPLLLKLCVVACLDYDAAQVGRHKWRQVTILLLLAFPGVAGNCLCML